MTGLSRTSEQGLSTEELINKINGFKPDIILIEPSIQLDAAGDPGRDKSLPTWTTKIADLTNEIEKVSEVMISRTDAVMRILRIDEKTWATATLSESDDPYSEGYIADLRPETQEITVRENLERFFGTTHKAPVPEGATLKEFWSGSRLVAWWLCASKA